MKPDWREATENGDCERVLALLTESADIDSLDGHGQTALINAVYRGDIDLVQLLVEHGAGLNHSAKYHLTALMLAVVNRKTEIVRILMETGANADLSGTEPFDCTPLKYAEEHGYDEIAATLREHT
ncbi:MAG TPA: ankyrin repeat domain-containing protein [Chromatiales bacterium]|nr:ankyrin repeat domain-containing protein [Chromatiales bacterium]HEX23099.1 ankyrin repeat domain-containing protein [Chromatiales bacterium]